MKKAIIFDVYGTLVSTGNASIKAVKEILNPFDLQITGEDFYSEWKALNRGYKNSECFLPEREIFAKSLNDLYQKYNIISDYKNDVNIMLNTMFNRKIFEDTFMALKQLSKDFRLLIGSTTDDIPLFQNIEYNKFDIIPTERIYTSEKLELYKPQKEFYKKILEREEIQSEEVVFVGDSLIDDVYGPKQLGIYTVLVDRKNTIRLNEIKPDKVVNSLLEIKNFIYEI